MSKSKSEIVYHIDKGIERPRINSGRKNKSKYDFISYLAIGDSFVVHSQRQATTLISNAKNQGVKLSYRKWNNDENPDAYRIWVISKTTKIKLPPLELDQ